MDRKKVLVLLPGAKIFGQETALINIGLMMRDEGIDFEYLTHGDWSRDVLNPRLAMAGFTVHPLPLGTIWGYRTILGNPRNLLWNLISLFQSNRRLSRLLERSRYDAILLCNISFSIFILSALEKSGLPVILRYGDEPPLGNAIYRHISDRVMARADVHVANCDYLRRFIQDRHGVTSARVIRNFPFGLEAMGSKFQGDRGDVPDRYLAYVGQISIHKGVDVLLDAFDRLASRFPALRLVVAGELPGVGKRKGAMLERIEASKRRWGDRVVFRGYVSDVRSLFEPGAIHLLPSIWDDPSPNVIFEAKACGVPSVVFARGGVPELIRHGVDGHICDGEDAGALTDGIMHFLGDDAAYDRAAAEARLSLETAFSEQRARGQWRDVMAEAFALASQPGGGA